MNTKLIAVVFASILLPMASYADIFSVTDAATEINTATTATNAGDTVKKLAENGVSETQTMANTAETVANLKIQIDQLKDSLKNLGSYQTSDASQLIGQLQSDTAQLQSINGSFNRLFPGGQPYQGNNYQFQFNNVTSQTLSALQSAMNVASGTVNNLNTQSTALTQVTNHAGNVVGQTQAIQTATEIASQQVNQLVAMQQLVASQATAQNAYYAAQIQKQATDEATQNQAIDAGSKTPLPGKPVSLPNF